VRARLSYRLTGALVAAVIVVLADGATAAGLGRTCGGRLGIGCDRGLFVICPSATAEVGTSRAPARASRDFACSGWAVAFAAAITGPTQTIVSGSERLCQSNTRGDVTGLD